MLFYFVNCYCGFSGIDFIFIYSVYTLVFWLSCLLSIFHVVVESILVFIS